MTSGTATAEMLILDEDAAVGYEWEDAIPVTVQGSYSYTVKYTSKYVRFLEHYTQNGETYDNVKQIDIKISIEDFTSYTGEDLQYVQSFLDAIEITQTQLYAKGIGYVCQYSDGNSSSNCELTGYTIK